MKSTIIIWADPFHCNEPHSPWALAKSKDLANVVTAASNSPSLTETLKIYLMYILIIPFKPYAFILQACTWVLFKK